MKGRREEAMVEKRSRLLSIVLTSNPGEIRNKMSNGNAHLGSLTTRSIVSDSCSAFVVS